MAIQCDNPALTLYQIKTPKETTPRRFFERIHVG
jgi:hypothetical protein